MTSEEPREAGAPITLRVNGKTHASVGGLSVHDFLESLDLNPALVVVELNREILSRSDYPEARLEDGDSLELVHFVGGG